MIKQKIELVIPYADGKHNNHFFNFEHMPPEVAKQLLGKWPNTRASDRQNSSPTAKKMIELASLYQGSLDGYCVPVESGRDDARIRFDSVTLHIDRQEALKLKRKLKPNNFTEEDKDTYSFWWD